MFVVCEYFGKCHEESYNFVNTYLFENTNASHKVLDTFRRMKIRLYLKRLSKIQFIRTFNHLTLVSKRRLVSINSSN